MGVFDFEENRLRQKEIEVQALVALAKYGVQVQKFEALKHLEHIAYPRDLANKIKSKRPWRILMPKAKCKNLHCGKFVRIPPNRAETSTGFCRLCYLKEVRNNG